MDSDIILKEIRKSFLETESYEIPLKVINDRQIFELELERIFSKSWIFLGFTDEIPKEGDYIIRYIGPDPFIIIRGDDGKIRGFFNSCRHRGSMICNSEYGNAKTFTCPYHGWTYDNKGKLIGMPLHEIVFKELDTDKWGLIEIKVQTYENLIFGSENPSLSLDQYLGEAKYYLDTIFKSTGGMKPIGLPFRFMADFNWKIGAENFSEDRLHTIMTHKSVAELGFASPLSRFGYVTPGKNEVSIADLKDSKGKIVGAFGFRLVPSENIRGYFGFNIKEPKIVDKRVDILKKVSHTVFTIFPNLSGFIAADSTDYPSSLKPRVPVSLLRLWQPISENKTEVWTWVIAPKETDDETAKRIYEVTNSHFGPSGAAEMDDTAIWRGITRVAGGYFSRFSFTALKGGGKDLPLIKDFEGPGVVRPTQFHEECQRSFWKAWIIRMTEQW